MDSPVPSPPLGLDALLPTEMADRAERLGIQKAQLDVLSLLALSVLAGAFIGLGAMFSTVVTAGTDGVLPFGVARLLSGLAFSLGLILVIVGGAELFTGNNLMVMAWASGRLRTGEMLRAWMLVYIGNFAGAVGTAALVFLTEDYAHGNAAVGIAALTAAQAKASLPMLPALIHGVLANVLVCLAVWLCYSARTTTDRILAIIPPITAFVAAGFEHSVANMYLIPFGMMMKHGATAAFWLASGVTPDAFPALTLRGLVANLIPVTIGNIIGGGVLVGAVYWFVYLRCRRPARDKP